MKLWHFIVIIAVAFIELMLAQEDGDFDVIDKDFDDVPRTHYHDHDDDGSFEARKTLEHVSFIVFCAVMKLSGPIYKKILRFVLRLS